MSERVDRMVASALARAGLVKRLRYYAETRVMGCQLAYPAGLNEAADHIEQLERELAEAKAEIDRVHNYYNP